MHLHAVDQTRILSALLCICVMHTIYGLIMFCVCIVQKTEINAETTWKEVPDIKLHDGIGKTCMCSFAFEYILYILPVVPARGRPSFLKVQFWRRWKTELV